MFLFYSEVFPSPAAQVQGLLAQTQQILIEAVAGAFFKAAVLNGPFVNLTQIDTVSTSNPAIKAINRI